MAQVNLRVSAVTLGGVLGPFGPPVVRTFHPASAMAFNCLAQPAPPHIRAGTYLADWILATSSVRLIHGAPMQLQPWFPQLSRHARSTVVETLGMATATAIAPTYGWTGWPLPIDNDIGPIIGGVRADLVYTLPSGLQVAAEARGRTTAGPVRGPNSTERDRALALAAYFGARQWYMSWVWLTAAGTTLDLFDPGEPAENISAERVLETVRARHAELAQSASGERISVRGREGTILRQQGLGPPQSRTDIALVVFDELQLDLTVRPDEFSDPEVVVQGYDGGYHVGISASVGVVMDVRGTGAVLSTSTALEILQSRLS
jgi:hypothetical protein